MLDTNVDKKHQQRLNLIDESVNKPKLNSKRYVLDCNMPIDEEKKAMEIEEEEKENIRKATQSVSPMSSFPVNYLVMSKSNSDQRDSQSTPPILENPPMSFGNKKTPSPVLNTKYGKSLVTLLSNNRSLDRLATNKSLDSISTDNVLI